MKKVYWDSGIWIALTNPEDDDHLKVLQFDKELRRTRIRLYASSLVIAETLVYPLGVSEQEAERVFRTVVKRAKMIAITNEVGRRAARIRLDNSHIRAIETADILHLACAASVGCDYFYTLEAKLELARVDDIGKIISPETEQQIFDY